PPRPCRASWSARATERSWKRWRRRRSATCRPVCRPRSRWRASTPWFDAALSGADGREGAVQKARLAVGQGAAVLGHDAAAGGFQHRLARSRIPFAGRAGARIGVVTALGDHAELQRGIHALPQPAAVAAGQAFGVFVADAVADQGGGVLRALAHARRFPGLAKGAALGAFARRHGAP